MPINFDRKRLRSMTYEFARRALATLAFIALWPAISGCAYWALTKLGPQWDIARGEIPPHFSVAIEKRAEDAPSSWRIEFLVDALGQSAPGAGESFRLSSSWQRPMCCLEARLIADAPEGQLVEVSYKGSGWQGASRYRVVNGRVIPLSHWEADFMVAFAAVFGGMFAAFGLVKWFWARLVERRRGHGSA